MRVPRAQGTERGRGRGGQEERKERREEEEERSSPLASCVPLKMIRQIAFDEVLLFVYGSGRQ